MPRDRTTMYDLNANDPNSVLVDRSHLSQQEVEQINDLMEAMAHLRAAERRVSEESERYMQLKHTDMRALHFIIVNSHRGKSVTAGMIARHLGITTASTTKLLDRLEAAAHVVRKPHVKDRRALVIEVTSTTHAAAMHSTGRMQASRFAAAAALSPKERKLVTRFLLQTAHDLEAAVATKP